MLVRLAGILQHQAVLDGLCGHYMVVSKHDVFKEDAKV